MVLIRILGWILILAAVAGAIAGAVLVATDRIPLSFLTAIYIVGPAIIVIFIGRAMTRAGRRGKGSYADQWTRHGAPKEQGVPKA